MNYYEELAVAQDASMAEIHQAYRALARLLHPDSQSDPKLKSAAERQMIRLNGILATLTDPEKRRGYDESLCTKLAVPEATPPPPSAPSAHRHLPWILACCILVAVGLWYLRSNEPGDLLADRGTAPSPIRSVQPSQTAPPVRPPPASEDRAPLSENRVFKRSPARPKPSPPPADLNPGENSAPDEPVNPLPEPREPTAAVPSVAAKTAALPVPPSPAALETPVQSQRTALQPAGTEFAGRWLYAPGSHEAQTPGMYPPEFIEFFLSEEQGILSGKYWARYRIPDKPVSPEVQFRVSGAPQAGVTTLKWVSDDGAKGQMKVVLRDANSMEVTWWTTAFGSRQMALASGTNVLVRQQVR